jgi:hypothetical protein
LHVAGPGPETIGRHRQPHVLSSQPPVPPSRYRAAEPEPLSYEAPCYDAPSSEWSAAEPWSAEPEPRPRPTPTPVVLPADCVVEDVKDVAPRHPTPAAAEPARRRHAALPLTAETPGRRRHGAPEQPAHSRRARRMPRRLLVALTLAAVAAAPVLARSTSSLGLPDVLAAQVAANPERAEETIAAVRDGNALAGASSTAATDALATGPLTTDIAFAAGTTVAAAAGFATLGTAAPRSIAAADGEVIVLDLSPVAGSPAAGSTVPETPADATEVPAPGTTAAVEPSPAGGTAAGTTATGPTATGPTAAGTTAAGTTATGSTSGKSTTPTASARTAAPTWSAPAPQRDDEDTRPRSDSGKGSDRDQGRGNGGSNVAPAPAGLGTAEPEDPQPTPAPEAPEDTSPCPAFVADEVCTILGG